MSAQPIASARRGRAARLGLLDIDVVVGMRGPVRDEHAQPREHEPAGRRPHIPTETRQPAAVGDRNRDERRKQRADRQHGGVERGDQADPVGKYVLTSGGSSTLPTPMPAKVIAEPTASTTSDPANAR